MISDEVRLQVRQSYEYRCAYCGVHENRVGSELTIDHFMPKSRGGSDALENLVYACPTCNRAKSDFVSIEVVRRILHPKHDAIAKHVAANEEGELIALTQTGAFHIQALKLNRPQLVIGRRERIVQQALLKRQVLMEQQIAQMEEEMSAMRLFLRDYFGTFGGT